MKSVIPAFSTARMVKDYVEKRYIPAHDYAGKIRENDNRGAAELAEWKSKLHESWHKIWITEVNPVDDFTNELTITLNTDINLDGLSPDDVIVEALLIREGFEDQPPVSVTELKKQGSVTGDRYHYSGELQIPKGGKYKYGIRVRPVHPLMKNPFEARLIRWMEF
ncbi:MAG: hypothetical protein U5N56_01645 [Candidatus Marinimicrobia bacterium]|nr:hypothetical protein [Candidatus Neomarinimicrobiota bacterium]